MQKIALLGGSGFVGSALANQLAQAGYALVVPTRGTRRARHLLVLPTIDLVAADVHNDADLKRVLAGCDAVVNLVGVLHAERGHGFERAHVTLPGRVAKFCGELGIPRLIHMSALNANASGPSAYLQSRGRGEEAVLGAAATGKVATTILQPSVIFGPGDGFLNLFAKLAALFPVMPLGSAGAKFQPVYVEDVARAAVAALATPETAGATFKLCGPRIYTLRELLELVMETTGHRRWVLELPGPLASLQAFVFEHLPGQLLTRDNLKSMQVDAVCGCEFPSVLGFAPTALEAVLPITLANQAPRERYAGMRQLAGR